MTIANRIFKVHGAEGHRQRTSFGKSFNFKRDDGSWCHVYCSDMTGTNDFTIIEIHSDTEKSCEDELVAQISDGVFENDRTGKIEEINHFYLALLTKRNRKYKYLKKVTGETKKLKGQYSSFFLQINYDVLEDKLWVDEFCGFNPSWVEYKSDFIISFQAHSPMTMLDINDKLIDMMKEYSACESFTFS